jgi:hypothetical protein
MFVVVSGGCFRAWDDYDPNGTDSTGIGHGALCGGVGVLTDDFSDGIIDDRFSVDDDGAVFERDGELVLAPHLDTGGCFTATIQSVHAFDLTGRVLGLELRALPEPSLETSLQIRLRGEGNNSLAISIDNENVSYDKTVNDESQTLASQRYAAADHRFFRFREAQGTVYWETSSDGQEWTERAKADVSTLFDVRYVSLALDAPGNSLGTPAEVRIDNLGGSETESCCAMGTFSDDFEDGVKSGAWTDPDCSEGCTASESGGQLAFNLDAAVSSYCSWTTSSAYDLRGSAVSIELTSPPDPSSDGQLLFRAVRDSGNYLEFRVKHGELHCAQVLDGECGDDLAFTQFSATDHRWLRFREQDGTIHFESSPDGVAWNPHTSSIEPFDLDAMQVMLEASSSAEQLSPLELRVDNLNLAR